MALEFDPVAYINAPDWHNSRPGLERITELLARLDNPQDALRVVHVAGTNGKGSTSTFIASVLQKAGYRTGLFTSPYIMEFAERIRINGCNMPADELMAQTLRLHDAAEAMDDHPTEFELMCALAFLHFKKQACDICVIEVGLGGRLDSTNVFSAPELSVITPIAFDHTAILGNTLQAIAGEKAGIVKRGAPVVCASQEDEALRAIAAKAGEMGAPLTCVDASEIAGTPADFSYREVRHARLGLRGSYQAQNAATAVEALMVLRQRGWDIPSDALVHGLEGAFIPGRFEQLGEEPPFIVDGGHNPQGIRALIDSLALYYPNRPVIFIAGVLADKDYSQMVETLVAYPQTRMLIAIEPPVPRALKSDMLAQAVRDELRRQDAQAARGHFFMRPRHEMMIREGKSIAAAVEAACGIAADLSDDRLARDSMADPFGFLAGWSTQASFANPVVVACGSLYSVGEVTRAYRALEARSGEAL